ncbi:hypothetical protein HNR19_000751 [Nocardioides thalensis]|uniref:Uncharacterized protein n=1 Tax=Nocardioides thalensis TaxID=1914755 RepID=A0A853C118_9ACTN|nr:hypothetical protein [Nocardioides thalensis]NYJ00053.1 hypothetical protein [Nocardioides thalensis]
MSSALDVRLYETAAAAPGICSHDQDLIVDLCIDAVAIALDVDVSHRGRTARSAVQLLLAEAVPHLPADNRGELARLCELVVVRGL